jgi:hypothetical protein
MRLAGQGSIDSPPPRRNQSPVAQPGALTSSRTWRRPSTRRSRPRAARSASRRRARSTFPSLVSRSSTSRSTTCASPTRTVNHLRERPTTLKRWRDGITGDFFFQKRVPEKRPEWLQTETVSFPSGRSATELVPNDAAHLIWAVNLSNIDPNPWPVRRADLDHPDELRIDLAPDVEPEDLRLDTVPERVEKLGDPAADIDDHAGRLDGLLDLARRDEVGGLGDARWPPHFAKQAGEPKRVQPSKARSDT